MTPEKFNREKAANGVQYVMLCTERSVKPQQHVYKTDGSEHFELWDMS